jgi:hypothetical protein
MQIILGHFTNTGIYVLFALFSGSEIELSFYGAYICEA